jgi:hypothetical protein
MTKTLLGIAAFVIGLMIVTAAEAQSRRQTSPNAGICPTGEKVANLADCPKQNPQSAKKKKTQ